MSVVFLEAVSVVRGRYLHGWRGGGGGKKRRMRGSGSFLQIKYARGPQLDGARTIYT